VDRPFQEYRVVVARKPVACPVVEFARDFVLFIHEQAYLFCPLKQNASQLRHAAKPNPLAALLRLYPYAFQINDLGRFGLAFGFEYDLAVFDPGPGAPLLYAPRATLAEAFGIGGQRVDAALFKGG
jgi:hypothetical protein